GGADGPVGLADDGGGQAVGRGAGADRVDLDRRLEDLGEPGLEPLGGSIRAVARGVALVGGDQRPEDLGRGGRDGVAVEVPLHRVPFRRESGSVASVRPSTLVENAGANKTGKTLTPRVRRGARRPAASAPAGGGRGRTSVRGRSPPALRPSRRGRRRGRGGRAGARSHSASWLSGSQAKRPSR